MCDPDLCICNAPTCIYDMMSEHFYACSVLWCVLIKCVSIETNHGKYSFNRFIQHKRLQTYVNTLHLYMYVRKNKFDNSFIVVNLFLLFISLMIDGNKLAVLILKQILQLQLCFAYLSLELILTVLLPCFAFSFWLLVY